tara:strand:+ start:1083 stop:1352 length:270 start_codon:yes stop_codon:yes gene_type:complete
MGGSNSKKGDDKYCEWDKIGGGCSEIVKGDNIKKIKQCKKKCLDNLIDELEDRKETLEKNINVLKIKLKRLSASSEKAASNGMSEIKKK